MSDPPFPNADDRVFDTLREGVLLLGPDLRVVRANRSFLLAFGVGREETVGRPVYELGGGHWDVPELRRLLEDVLPGGEAFDGFEVDREFPGLGRRVMILNARRLRGPAGDPGAVLLAVEDATARRLAEEARRDLETRFTALVRNVRDHAIFTTDSAGNVASWNAEAGRIIGYSEGEILGRHFSVIFTDGDREAGVPEEELRLARERGRAEDERWHRRKGGGLFWALGVVTPMRDAEGRLTGYSKILRDMTDRKRAEEELRRLNDELGRLNAELEDRVRERTAELRGSNEQLAALAAGVTRAEHRERRRLARLLHDDVQQLLTAAATGLDVELLDATGDPPDALARVRSIVGEAIDATRDLAVRLAPPLLHDRGLPAAVEWLAARSRKEHGLEVATELGPDASPPEAEGRDALYQAAHELLLNTAKHAAAGGVFVSLTRSGGEIRLEVRDGGPGFDAAALEGGGGSFGLLTVRGRLESLGGSLSVERLPAGGSCVSASLPAESPAPLPE